MIKLKNCLQCFKINCIKIIIIQKNIQKALNNIIGNSSNLASPPGPQPEENVINPNENILNEISAFLKDKLKNQFQNTSKEFQILKRISFIGKISSGKSKDLNCIIGENIFPIKELEDIYRGIIIKTSVISKGILIILNQVILIV